MKQSLHSLGIAFVTLSLLVGCGGKKKRVKIEKELEMLEDVDLRDIRPEEDFFDEEDNLNDIEEFAFINEENKDLQDLEGESLAQGPEVDSEMFAYVPEIDSNLENKDMPFEAIQFRYNSDRLREDQVAALHKNIEEAKKAVETGKNVEVRAYRCQLGDAVYNMALSQRSANAIKEEMIKHGIPEDKIIALGCGQENPVVTSNATDRETRIQDLSPNRRVEISLS